MIELGIPRIASQGIAVLEQEDLFRHVYVVGKPRTGKSTFLLNIIDQNKDDAMIVIDPAGTFALDVAGIVPHERIRYIDINHPININPLSKENWASAAKEFVEVMNACVTMTTSTKESTVLMEEFVLHALRVFKSEHKNIEYLSDFLNHEQIRKKHFTAFDKYWSFFDDREKNGWYKNREKRDSAKRVGSRLSAFHVDPNISRFVLGENEFDVKDIVAKKQIAIFNLRGFDTNAQIYLGNLITHAIKTYYQYEAVEKGDPLTVYIDEFHRFINPFFGDMFSQCSKYNIGMLLAHQSHVQVSRDTLSMVLDIFHTMTTFTSRSEVSKRMAEEYGINRKELMSLGRYEAYVLIDSDTHKVGCFPPPVGNPYKPPIITPYQSDFEAEDNSEKQAEPISFLRDAWITA